MRWEGPCNTFHATGPGESRTTTASEVPRRSVATLMLAQIASFSALVAVGTIVTNLLLGIALPYPLYEITLAPAFYFAISVLYPRKVSFWSIAIGSAIGEAINIFVIGPAAPAIFVPGIVWARAPESLIIYRFREKSVKWVTASMALATVYETLAFYVPDAFFYAYALFSYSVNPAGLLGGFGLAIADFGTLVDLVWIPVALALIEAVRKAFRVKFLD